METYNINQKCALLYTGLYSEFIYIYKFIYIYLFIYINEFIYIYKVNLYFVNQVIFQIN